MLDIVSLRLNRTLIATTLDRDNQAEERFDPLYSRNPAFNTLTGLIANRLSAASVLTVQGATNGDDANATLRQGQGGVREHREPVGRHGGPRRDLGGRRSFRDRWTEDQVALDLEGSFVMLLSSGLRTGDIQSASVAATAETDVATAQATLSDLQSKVLGARERLAHSSTVNFRSVGFLKSSADGTLFDQDERLRYNAEIADLFRTYVRVQVGQDALLAREQEFTFSFSV